MPERSPVPPPAASPRVVLTVFGCLLLLAFAAAWLVHSQGWTLYYGDAEARLNNARKIIDSRTPGYEQIGTGWLPFPSVLMLPLVSIDSLWHTGLAGTVVGIACFVLAGMSMFGAARIAYNSVAGGICAAALLALNPNLLYLQATPMTEHIFMALTGALLYCILRFRASQHLGWIVAAALCSGAASLTRYDGWLLLPFATVFIFISGRGTRYKPALLFALVAGVAPLYWLAHNLYFYSDPLEFYRGQWSAKAIYERGVQASGKRHPFDHNWSQAMLYYRFAAVHAVGLPLALLSTLGSLIALWRRAFWPILLLALPPAFYILSLHSGTAEIFVPDLWPHSYYNSRYGLAFLPFAAFSAGSLATVVPTRRQTVAVLALTVIAVAPWLASPRPDKWICWKESQRNSDSRRAWTTAAADIFSTRYRSGDGVFFSYGDLAGVLRHAGIPLREGLHDGNGPLADLVVVRPDLFLREEWALAIEGDRVARLLAEPTQQLRYKKIRTISVTGASPVHLYRRIEPLPTPW